MATTVVSGNEFTANDALVTINANFIDRTYVVNPTAGNLLVAVVVMSEDGDITLDSVTGGGSWAESHTSTHTAPGSNRISVWHCYSATGGATTVRFNFTNWSSKKGMFALTEVNMTAGTKTPVSANGSSSIPDPGDLTGADATNFMMAVSYHSTSSVANGSGWTAEATQNPWWYSYCQTRVDTSGLTSAAFTVSAGTWHSAAVLYEAAAGGGGGIEVLRRRIEGY